MINSRKLVKSFKYELNYLFLRMIVNIIQLQLYKVKKNKDYQKIIIK